mmetsp:Transcript_25701/g.73886  ORF Transcript_25701/g.73886 Transcript_25701/m.73886 type:complete len:354 (+) Transcript_25701:56-1117(+)
MPRPGSFREALAQFPIDSAFLASHEVTAEETGKARCGDHELGADFSAFVEHSDLVETSDEATAVETLVARFTDPESAPDSTVFVEHGDHVKDLPIFVPELTPLELDGVRRQATMHRRDDCPPHFQTGDFLNEDMTASLIMPPSTESSMSGWTSSLLRDQQVAKGSGSQTQADHAPINVLRERALAGLGLSGCTTVMIRNIPTTFTQNDLMQQLSSCGFGGMFDFIYVPADSRKRKNRGIGFVNFTSKMAADAFYQMFHGTKSMHLTDAKEIFVTPADVQGYEENAERFAAEFAAQKHVCNLPILLRSYPRVGSAAALPQTHRHGARAPTTCTACNVSLRFAFSFCPFCGVRLT